MFFTWHRRLSKAGGLSIWPPGRNSKTSPGGGFELPTTGLLDQSLYQLSYPDMDATGIFSNDFEIVEPLWRHNVTSHLATLSSVDGHCQGPSIQMGNTWLTLTGDGWDSLAFEIV